MSKYKTEALLKKKRIKRNIKISLMVLLICAITYVISFASSYEKFQIKEIEVVGNKYVESPHVVDFVKSVSAESYFKIFSKNNILFLPREHIISELEKELTIDRVVIKSESLAKIKIEIYEHEPWAIWCNTEKNVKDCSFVNNDGLAFMKSSEIVVQDLIQLSGEVSGDILGKNYVTPELFDKFVIISDLLTKINVAISQISTTDYETFILHTKNGPQLFIDKNDDPVEVVNNLKTTIEQESIHDIQFKNIEYVDLRFDGKAYYKIR